MIRGLKDTDAGRKVEKLSVFWVIKDKGKFTVASNDLTEGWK